MSVRGLEKLDVWCKARDFAVRIHKEILPFLPQEEKWVFRQQIRRSSQSNPANMAEGHGRFYFQENVRFCYIARDSLEETLSWRKASKAPTMWFEICNQITLSMTVYQSLQARISNNKYRTPKELL